MSARITQYPVLTLSTGTPKVRMTQQGVLVLAVGNPTTRVTQLPMLVLVANTSNQVLSETLTDNITFTETIDGINSHAATINDTIAFVDIVAGYDPVFRDTVGFVDTIESNIYPVTISDVLTLSDTLSGFNHNPQLDDTITFSETMQGFRDVFLTLSDDLIFSDSIPIVEQDESTDTITFTDDATGAIWRYGPMSDAVVLTENLLLQLVANRKLSESVVFLEQLTQAMVRLLGISETVNFVDTLNGIAVKVLGDSVDFTDLITEVVSKIFKDTLEFGDVLTQNHVTQRSMGEQFTIFDSLSYSAIIRQTLLDTLTLSDTLFGYNVKQTHDVITFNETLSGDASTPLNDTLSFSDGITYTKSFSLTLGDTVTFQDAESPQLLIQRTLQDSIEFLEAIKGIRVKFGNMTDTASFTDDMLRAVYGVGLDDVLTFSEEWTYTKDSTRELDDSLSYLDELDLTKVSKLGWSDYILWREGFIAKISKASNVLISGDGITQDPTPTLPPDAPPDLYIPSAVWLGVIQVLPQVVFKGWSNTILLPPPEFNDFIAGQSKIAVQRSMSGSVRVYAKRTTRERLNWRFTIPKYKADEFKTFLKAEINNPITLIDWEGNYWDVRILSDSVSFIETRRWEPCGNAVDVTVELVGTRYV